MGTDDLREPPLAGDEVTTLLGSLERQRRTFAWKCGGLDGEPLGRRLGPSTVTLGGLIKHLALVEEYTLGTKFLGEPLGPPWIGLDLDANPDAEWETGATDPADELWGLWRHAVARSRAIVTSALAESGLDTLSPGPWPPDGRPSLRRLLIDLVEEYARHVGHADLLRESIDGATGEDPPDDYVLVV